MNTNTAGRLPTIFVSSTCYDLSQIRKDIREFIVNQMGYEALLSEFDSFPLDPNINTVENCLKVVQERADIFVLIVGGRYGFVTDNGKSITNLEYLRAKTKGIPVYVFIETSIISMLSLWKDNPNGNFSSVVDSPKLFEFVEQLMNIDGVWVYSFKDAQGIINTLRQQIAYLLFDSLNLRKRLTASPLSKSILKLDSKSFDIATSKPFAWEYKLYSQIINHGFNSFENLKRDFQYGIWFGNNLLIDDIENGLQVIITKIEELLNLTSMLTILINESLPVAFGAPGVSGDVEHIIYSAERTVDVYEKILLWGVECKALSQNEQLRNLITSISKACDSVIEDLDAYSNQLFNELSQIPEKEEDAVPGTVIKVDCVLREPDFSDFYTEIETIKYKNGLF